MKYFVFVLLFFFAGQSQAQPQLSTEETIEGVKVFRDFKKVNTYYYAPGALKLALNTDGEPRFKLIQLRYTGTFATGDQGQSRFMNIVQFSVEMQQIDRELLNTIRQNLGNRAVLRPLPLRNVEAYLVAPYGESFKRVGASGSLEGEGTLGQSSRTSFWTERTFTLRLENHEAELLWNLVEEGQLAISVNYAFFADAVNDRPSTAQIKGKTTFKEELGAQLEDLLQGDTLPSLQVIRADAFPIRINTKDHPQLLVREEVDAGIPPAYPALEVQCYDFTDELRPDLAIKAIEVEATGVNDYPIRLKAFKFTRSQADLHTHQIRFPYAVKMDKPFRYRVREYGLDGSVTPYSDWTSRDSWSGRLNITTSAAENTFNKRLIELETDLQAFEEQGVTRLELHLIYHFNEKLKKIDLHFSPQQPNPLQQLNLVHDKGTSIQCLPVWVMQDESVSNGEIQIVGQDNYLYFNIPEK